MTRPARHRYLERSVTADDARADGITGPRNGHHGG